MSWMPGVDKQICELGEDMFGNRPLPSLEVLHLTNIDLGDQVPLRVLIASPSVIYEIPLKDFWLDSLFYQFGSATNCGLAALPEILKEATPRLRDSGISRGIFVQSPVSVRDAERLSFEDAPRELGKVAYPSFDVEADGNEFNAADDYIRGSGSD